MGGKNTTEQQAENFDNAIRNNNSVRKNSGNVIVKILIIIIIILIGAVGFLAYHFLMEKEDDREVHDGRMTFVSSENVDEVRKELEEEIEDAYYTTCMTFEWNFYDGKSVSTDAYVENPTENTRMVYFDVNLADTGELVYSSPYLPVGEVLKGFALDTDLPAGDYSAVVTYHLVDDDKKEITTVAVSIVIHVLN